MNFGQTIIAEIIGGIASGLIVAIGLYFIFDKFLLKKPKIRLYIPPNPNIDNTGKFQSKFYLHNVGNLTAKNVIFTANFDNLEIVKIIDGFQKNDEIGGVQRILKEDVIHPYPIKPWPQNTRIGEIFFKIKDSKKDIKVNYTIAADDMEFFNGVYRIQFIK